MLIFLDANLVFFSTPKTGSSAYHAILKHRADIAFAGMPKIKHMTVRDFDRHIVPYLKKSHKRPERIAVIRDPLAQLGSWYRYRRRAAKKGKSASTINVSFDEFIRAYLSEDRPPYAKIGSQFKFVSSSQQTISVNHLFAYERTDLLREFLEQRLGFDCSTNKANVSPKGDLAICTDTERRLRDVLARDFDLHNRILKEGGHLVTKL